MARTKKLTLSLHRTRLVFNFRKFKTQKAARSKRLKQLVLPIYGSRYKELAITKSRITNKGRKLKPGFAAARLYVLLIVAGLIGAVYFGLHLNQQADIKLVASTSHTTEAIRQPRHNLSLDRSIPTGIKIESIGLDTSLRQVGLKTDGSLEVPSDTTMAGWYDGSPTPGEIGPAVIDGHVDRVGGIAVFWRLRELKPGDTVEVSRSDGSIAKFRVDSLEQFAQDSFPTNKVYGNINYAGIRLITCGGIFNSATGHYSDNIVVFGSLINQAD